MMNTDELHGCLVLPPLIACPSHETARKVITLTKRTLFLDDSVIQVGLAATRDLPRAFRIIAERWFDDQSTQFLYSQLQAARLTHMVRLCGSLPKEYGWRITVPVVKQGRYGVVHHGNLEFPYWEVELAKGESLLKLEGDGRITARLSGRHLEDAYRSLATFLGTMHSDQSSRLVVTSLREYYLRRFQALVACIEPIASSRFAKGMATELLNAVNIVKQIQGRIENCIGKHERVCIVHGDFRGNNLLIDVENCTISVIDFGQGLFGGDHLTDLNRLKLVHRDNHPFLSVEAVRSAITVYRQAVEVMESGIGGDRKDFCHLNQVCEDRLNFIRVDKLGSFLVYAYLRGFYDGALNDDANFTPISRVRHVLTSINEIATNNRAD